MLNSADLDFSRQIGELVDRKDASVGTRKQPVVNGQLAASS